MFQFQSQMILASATTQFMEVAHSETSNGLEKDTLPHNLYFVHFGKSKGRQELNRNIWC